MESNASESDQAGASEAQAPVPDATPAQPQENFLVLRFLQRGKLLSFERRSKLGVEWTSGEKTETLVNLVAVALVAISVACCLLSFMSRAPVK
jgi:hypothetical protein